MYLATPEIDATIHTLLRIRPQSPRVETGTDLRSSRNLERIQKSEYFRRVDPESIITLQEVIVPPKP